MNKIIDSLKVFKYYFTKAMVQNIDAYHYTNEVLNNILMK